LTIVAGLMVGLSLGIQSAHLSRAKALDEAVSAGRVRISAPWYIAMNADCSAASSDSFAGQPRDIRPISS